jgi:hypothetical protein
MPFMGHECSSDIRNTQRLVPVLKQINVVHTLSTESLRFILILSSHLLLGLQRGIICPIGLRTASPAHLMLLDLITAAFSEAIPLHAMMAFGGRGCIAPHY